MPVLRRSISLEQIDVEILEDVRKTRGLGSKGFSTAFRMIIREWKTMNDQRFRITPEGRHALIESDPNTKD